MTTHSETQIALTMLPALNSMVCRPLFEKCGGIEGFFMESRTALNRLYGEFHLKPDHFNREKALAEAKQEAEHMVRHNIETTSFEQRNYPPLLAECHDAPLAFYYKGHLPATPPTCLAIVGTRRSTEYGRQRVENVIKQLAQHTDRPVIVSGLAFGIDGAAHQAANKYGLKTYAVLGHGLHMIYPAAHKNMADCILKQGGALLSEFPTTATILPVNFLKRNRIIAGLARATLIAESAKKGGAMSTARIAHSYNREVMAFPGRPEDKTSAGCNELIKGNIASLVDDADDIQKGLGMAPLPPQQTCLAFPEEPGKTSGILTVLTEKGGADIDELSRFTHLPVHELAVIMLELELEGKVISLPGNNYIPK